MENLETGIVTDRDDIKGRGTKDLGISKPSLDKVEAVSMVVVVVVWGDGESMQTHSFICCQSNTRNS